jgi:8-amino-7-oxononanoate synthase
MTVESPIGAEVIIDGQRYVNFGGSSYLGLSANKEIVEAGVVALRESGSGYQFPREIQIVTRAHLEAESEAATFFNTQSALYLAGGYYFGLVAMAKMREKFNKIFYDEWAHFSLREAIAASGLPSYAYRHLDVADLCGKLKKHVGPRERPVVITDGLYATFGEIAPLKDLADAMIPYEGHLLVDESHSFGVLGAFGRGACEEYQIPLAMACIGGSTSKAFGAVGGIIPASEEEVTAFRQTPAGRGAAAGLPAAASMCAASFRYVRRRPELLQRLRENIARLKTGLRRMGVDVGDNLAPIAAFKVGSREDMRALHEQLMSEGIFVMHTTYIGASKDGVIRCGVFADHTNDNIDQLLDALRRFL